MPTRVRDAIGTRARIRRTGDGVGARKFRLKRSRGVNMSVCAVVAADPVHEEMSWLNAEAN